MKHEHDDAVSEAEFLILQGRSREAIELLRGLDVTGAAPQVHLVLGDAYRAIGEFAAALEIYARVVSTPASTVPLAYRIGQVYYAHGDPARAVEVYAGAEEAEAAAVDQALLLAGLSTAHWRLGDCDRALGHARAAGAHATLSGDPQAKAVAHVAMALAVSLGGDPATVDEEYGRAAHFAAEAGDLVLLARIKANRSHHLLADARFADAVEVAVAAGAAAERFGSVQSLSVALGNEAEGLVRLGRYDEAVNCCERVLSLAGQIGTSFTAGALIVLAQVHLRLGCREQARAALEQALRLQGDRPDRQVRVPAMALLAVALLPDDVERAWGLATEALREATGSQRLPALVAAGRTAWARGESAVARDLATQAVEHARQRRERGWLAEALELRALTVDRCHARAALSEALQIWQSGGADHDADRVLVRLARTVPSSAADRVAARLALSRLEAAGIADLAHSVGPSAGRVRIVTFGRLEVFVDGLQVPAESWQSRRARDLLRLLVCWRGRAVPRLQICEALWPDDDPDRTNHRLSVLLSIVRGVLGSDTIVSDQACVALDVTRVQIDVEQFLTDVRDAVALHEQGAGCDAAVLLAQAVDSYCDEPFADAPYDDVAAPLRDEARAAFLEALRLLAGWCRRAGSYDQSANHLRRLLHDDRYDEDAHRTLIGVLNRAGRHGQARSAAGRYRSAMAEIGLRPAG